jgi:hypothetical protein
LGDREGRPAQEAHYCIFRDNSQTLLARALRAKILPTLEPTSIFGRLLYTNNAIDGFINNIGIKHKQWLGLKLLRILRAICTLIDE